VTIPAPALQIAVLEREDFDYFSSKLKEISGIHMSEKKLELVQTRLFKRLTELKLPDFKAYRDYLSRLPMNAPEWQLMLNELTTNKTEFFREVGHFDYLLETFLPEWERRSRPGTKLRVWSAACSTGEEPYSLAMALDQYFDGEDRFEIVASDIDTTILAQARNAVYPLERLASVPPEFHARAIAQGTGELADWGKIKDPIHGKIRFMQCNLDRTPYPMKGPFDVIFCRNVFIYFEPKTIERIVASLHDLAASSAMLAIGQSESLQGTRNPWKYVVPSIFRKSAGDSATSPPRPEPAQAPATRPKLAPGATKKKRVLVVDDSKAVTKLLTRILNNDPQLEVVGEINDPSLVQSALLELKPDVMTLDIHMPKMDGCAVLEQVLPAHPIPTVMISSISMEEGPKVLRALELGAVDYVQKPSLSELKTVEPLIIEKVKNAANAKVQRGRQRQRAKQRPVQLATTLNSSALIAIGSSTGGTEALTDLLTQLPPNIPPILIVQHIPPIFSKAFANRLNDLCSFEVKEAEDGDEVRGGRVLVAPGGRHMTLERHGMGLRARLNDEPPVNRHKPSVDVMFDAVAALLGKDAIGVILTGMGADGAKGMLRMKQAGAETIAQDEESCVVFGMPKEAIRMGGAAHVVSLSDIPAFLVKTLAGRPRS
jgi:two-component system chemotaxis response regulator CheB